MATKAAKRYQKPITLLWKIYFWVWVLVVIGSILGSNGSSKPSLFDHIDLIATLPSVIAVYGWAWQKRMVFNWQVWFAYAVIFLPLDVVFNTIRIFEQSLTVTGWIMQTIGVCVLLLPSYGAIVFYPVKFLKPKAQGSAH